VIITGEICEYRAHCQGCGAESRECDTINEAFAMWNLRAKL
jgi:hypothetical protein